MSDYSLVCPHLLFFILLVRETAALFRILSLLSHEVCLHGSGWGIESRNTTVREDAGRDDRPLLFHSGWRPRVQTAWRCTIAATILYAAIHDQDSSIYRQQLENLRVVVSLFSHRRSGFFFFDKTTQKLLEKRLFFFFFFFNLSRWECAIGKEFDKNLIPSTRLDFPVRLCLSKRRII